MSGDSRTSLVARARKYYNEKGLKPLLSLTGFYVPSLLFHRRFGTRSYNESGRDIFEAEWDNLILLDACRYDFFQRHSELPDGNTRSIESRASSTSEFIRANFSDRTLHDTVYISANPWYMKLRDEIGAKVFEYYDVHNEPEERPHVDQMYKTTETALKAAVKHPNKRLLIHYAPPHHPLIGPTAEEYLPSIESQMEMGFYERIRRGELNISDKILKQAYAESLEIVLNEVEKLVREFEGKTVISADHGEMLGERASPIPVKYYGHIPGVYTNELVAVPWHECDFDHRRRILSEEPTTNERTDINVDDQLRDLGYKV